MNFGDLSNYVSKFNIFAEPDETKGVATEVKGHMKALKADTSRSFIASGLIVNGSLSSDADIMVDGLVYGDVASKGDVIIHGKIEGGVSGRNIHIVGAEIIGDIRSSGNLVVHDSVIRGNIHSFKADLDSKVIGNITILESLTIRSTGDISGDIVAASVAIEERAVIDGKQSIKKFIDAPEAVAERVSSVAADQSQAQEKE